MPASVRLAAASAVAASLFATALPANSADLYAPYGSAYEEPRYGDVYGDDAPAYERYSEPRDAFEPPYRHRGSFRDEFKDEAFDSSYDSPRYARRGDHCVPRHIAHARLRDDGWRDFHDFEARGNVVLMQARRPSGRLFDLTIDTCSGEVITARPLFAGRAFAGAPRRYWQQPY